jgi:phenylacetate-CoA ligase
MTYNLRLLRFLKYNNVVDAFLYKKWFNFIEDSQWWSKDEINIYQWERVKQLLDHAYHNVPYYNDLFKKLGAEPNDVKTWLDFSKIPFLTKDLVRERAKDLVAKTHLHNKRLQYYTTGGSTGQPLGFYKTQETSIIESAFMNQQWKRVGYNESSSRIILRGEPIANGKLFLKYRFTNDWLLSSYHLSEEYLPEYVRFLNRIKPNFFHVYPTSLYVFTQLLLKSPLKLSFSPIAILCGSEPVYKYQRELFEKVYNCRVYSWLGSAEGTALAGECEHSEKYHSWPQHSYVELIEEKSGLPIVEVGRVGEIVGTSINNYSFPFIRYKSSDIAEYGGQTCPLCHRNGLLLDRIVGRQQDVLILVDGRTVPLTAITFGLHFNAYGKIKKMQLVQNTKGNLIINLSVLDNTNFNEDDESEIISKMMNAVDGKLTIEIQYTSDFVTTKSGKHRYFIQNIQSGNLI